MADSVAILGGTFNPPHIGHLAMARYALEHFASKVYFVPCGKSVHKQHVLDFSLRKQMLQLLLTGEESCEISDIEAKRKDSYTIDTLVYFTENFSHVKRYFLLGEDAFVGISGWRDWQHFSSYVHMVIFHRTCATNTTNISDEVREFFAPKLKPMKWFLSTQHHAGYACKVDELDLDISSSSVRTHDYMRHYDNENYQQVLSFIQQNNLYK